MASMVVLMPRTRLLGVNYKSRPCCLGALSSCMSSGTPQKRRTQTTSLSSRCTAASNEVSPSLPTSRHLAASGSGYLRSSGGIRHTALATPYTSRLMIPRSCFSTSPHGSVAASTVQSVRPEPPDHLDEKEKAIFDKLTEALTPTELQVEDISGGCGSMYAVGITSKKFKGLSVIKQHRLVNEVLGEDIKSWHGIQLRTKAP